MNADLVVAIDAGTQSIRAALVNPRGEIVAMVKTPVEPYYSRQPGWAEQDPQYLWEQLCLTTRQVLEGVDPARLAAVSLATQRVTVVNVDADGTPVRPAIVWIDNRKADARQVVPRTVDLATRAVGLHGLVTFAAEYSRSNWIRQHEPDVWARTHRYLFLSGFFTHRLTGDFVDSTANIYGTVPFDVRTGTWVGEKAITSRLFPIERDKLPRLVKPTEVLGEVTATAADQTGLPTGLPMIAAASDKACDVLGAGCLSSDVASISLGTTATINVHTSKYVELRRLLQPYAAAVPGQFHTEVAVMRGLWLVSWFKQEFGLPERLAAAESEREAEDLLEDLVTTVPPGAMGLVCQPTWMPGPLSHREAKGAVFGFGDVHTRAHLYRAILEGIVFGLRQGAELTQRKTKVPLTEVRASGGGSRSDALMQITADIFGLPTRRAHTPETSSIGAAIDAAVGVGLHPDIRTAVAEMTRPGRTFEPDQAHVRLYDALYAKVWEPSIGRLMPIYRSIREVVGYPN